MKTIQLINYIASHPEFTLIVFNGFEEKTPMQAIENLSCEVFQNEWRINGSLEKNTLIVYDIR